MPLSPEQLLSRLAEMAIPVTTVSHAAVFTVAQSSSVTASIPGGHTKNLFVKDKKDNFFLIVAEGSTRLDINRLHGLIGARSRLSFGSAQMLMELLGVEPGSVTAFAAINDTDGRVAVVIDEPLLAHDAINCHPLTNTMTTTISRQDLLKFLKSTGHQPRILALSAVREPRHEPSQ
jgi:Ala-tRNA(Pro) deacylase